MAVERIPPEVAALLQAHVESYEQLETLVQLGRDEGQEWSTDAVASELRVSPATVADALAHLTAAGLVVRRSVDVGDLFRWHPDSTSVLRQLADVYREDRVELISLMTKCALDRVRTSALRTFSASFLLGRKRDG